MSSVGIKKCESYRIEDVKNAFKELFTGLDKDKIKDKKILIFFDYPFPNYVILDYVINFLKEEGASKISVGTSLFIEPIPHELMNTFSENNVEFTDFRQSQYERLDVPYRKNKRPEHFRGFAVMSPVQYAEEKSLEKIEQTNVRTMKNVLLPVSLTDSDFVVPIIKMKDSPIFKIGGFVNSMLYLVPTITRGEIFVNMLEAKHIESVLEIFNIFSERTLFGIVDGIEGDLSQKEELNRMQVLLFSTDLLSLDSLTSVLIGFRSSEIETNKVGDVFGFGKGLLQNIELYGDNFEKVRKDIVKNLKYANEIGKRRSNIPHIAKTDPTKIKKAMDFCSTGAIEEKDGEFSINKDKCIKCNFCVQIAHEIFKLK